MAFPPDRRLAAEVDRKVRNRLGDSLHEIGLALAEAGADSMRVEGIAAGVRQGPVSPAVFAFHAGLIDAILDEDGALVERMLNAAVRLPPPPGAGMAFVTLDDAMLGFAGASELYRQLAADDEDSRVRFAPISAAELGAQSAEVKSGIALLGRAAPELSGEIEALVRQIVLVSPAEDSERDFGGASTFHLWGAVFLNGKRHPTRVAMAEGLVHEAAHLRLFGEAQGGRVVANDDDQRYRSPLREDARPLDGIAHATFVLARMTYCMKRLLQSRELDTAERAEAEESLARNRRDYLDGAAVIARHARLTEAGARMLDAAATYMSQNELTRDPAAGVADQDWPVRGR